MRLLTPVVVATLVLSFPLTASAQVDARMLRFPDVSDRQVVFVYAGDLWTVSRDGGLATRLSSPRGEEQLPRFSPSGERIAFAANYDGNQDLYVIPTSGGLPTRLTSHPADDRMVEWIGEDEILFASERSSGTSRFNQLWRIPADGGLPTRLPVPYGETGTFTPDGAALTYQTLERDFRTWKRYRGGMAPDIWWVDLTAGTSRKLTDHEANDAHPMWHGDTMYFLSDRGPQMRSNLWALEPGSSAPRQVTTFTDFDVRFPAIGPADIVFEAGGELYLMSLADEQLRRIEVRVTTDQASLRPRREAVGDAITSGAVAPAGERAVFAARGDLFTVPAEHGPVRTVAAGSRHAHRDPTWSPDGRWIAAWSDASGEYEIELRAADGTGETRTLTSIGAGFGYTPWWSPDSEHIAFIDHASVIWLLAVDSGELTQVDELPWALPHPALASFRVSWSGDGGWLAWSRTAPTGNQAIFLHRVSTGETRQVTSAFYDDMAPAFDPDGEYLFFLTNRHYEPSYSDFDGTWIYANATRLAAATLRPDVASPVAPREDVVELEDPADEDGDSDPAADEVADDETSDDAEDGDDAPPLEIDLEGLEQRTVLLPPDAGNLGRTGATSDGVLYLRSPRTGVEDGEATLMLWHLEDREEKTVLAGVDDYELAADGSTLLVDAGGRWALVEAAPGQKIEEALRTSEMATVITPRDEWRQIFDDVWRFERDWFYDPGMHGLDWPALRERYGALIDHCATRWDVNFVIGELIGELSASHAYRGGGDLETAPSRGVGLLGVDWELAEGAYRIARIVRGAPWETDVRSPLDDPGVEVAEGDWVLAVNGVPVDTGQSPHAAFDGLAGTTVALTVNDRPSLEGAREVLVETLRSEARLRNLEWIEHNRRAVAEASDGRVGYVFVPDTGINGQNELVRQMYAQSTVDGLIVDERFNGGGQWPDRFVELLDRRRAGYVRSRYGQDPWLAPLSRTGPTVMLVNSWAGSGGDAFPFLFRDAGLGPIIGTRTWGGLIGISGGIQLVDGGMVTVPTAALYTTGGEWMLEGRGLAPDIEVVDDPALMLDGGDPQLERAIAEVQRLLAADPPAQPTPPAYEDRTAAGRR